MFLLKVGSRRQVRFALRTPSLLKNLNRLAGTAVSTHPHSDTLEYSFRKVLPSGLEGVRAAMVRRLVRSKCLDRYRVFGYFLLAIDGSGHLVFSKRHCDTCLTQKQGSHVTYYHMVLEAKLVAPNGLALSVMTEFIENADPEATKQDCELKAFHRMLPRLRATFPQMPLCFLLDGLYLSEPMLEVCREGRWLYVATFKEGHMPERWREYEALRDLVPQNRKSIERPGGVRQEYAWLNDLDVGAERMHVVECRETSPEGLTTRFAWGTSLPVEGKTVEAVAHAGRLRWKIENEGFNEEKCGGYNLEHAYSHDAKGAKNYYLLLQIARCIDQLLEKGDLLRKGIGGTVAAIFGGVRQLGYYLRESLRNWEIPEEAVEPAPPRSFQIRLDTS